MSDLKKKAEALGIKIDGRWNDERIQEEIDSVTAANATAEQKEKLRLESEAKEKSDAEAAAKLKAEQEAEAKKAEEARIAAEEKARLESEAQVKALEKEQAAQSVTITNLQGNPMRSLGLEAYGEAVMPGHVASEPRMALKIERAKALGLIKVSK